MMISDSATTAAFGTATGKPPARFDSGNCHLFRTAALVVVCGATLTIAIGNDRIASAFTPAYRQSPLEKRNNKPTAFHATSYLESLGADTKNDSKDMLKSLRDQRSAIRNEKFQSQQQAIYDAMRRTSPMEAAAKRMRKEQQERKRKERDKLKRLYVEKKEQLDAKKRNALSHSRNGKRGIPILDRPSFIKASPLLVGSTLNFQYSDLIPFQRRAIEVARWHHEEHCERMKFEDEDLDEDEYCSLPAAGDEGGIQAAPIIALIDSYTADPDESSVASIQAGKPKKRFATLAAIGLVYDNESGEPSAVNLMGVGRVYLHDHFSSKDALMSGEEEELSQLLSKMHNIDREHELHDDDTVIVDHDECNEDHGELQVVMAEFDLLLDDSSVLSKEVEESKYGEDVTKNRVSSMHAITELYRSANKVYRLHEERKKLMAGLRAGKARLRLGKEREIDENCLVEFEDCDGLGMIGGMMDDPMGREEEETSTPYPKDTTPRSRLEALDNYGLGSFGILSTIPDLTVQLMSHLEPYYSPNHREREEYEAEVASMIAFRTLEEYASPEEVAAALLAPSATQRLEMAYGIMIRHRDELYELVEMISQELGDCGEECADLW